jgi:glutathione S-transferase
MVTAETTNDVLFAREGCILSKFIELVTKFLPLPPKIIKFNKPNKEILVFSKTKTFPVLKSGDDFVNGALPIIKYLIKSAKDISDGVVLDNRVILLGKNMKEEAKVDMWLNFIYFQIIPITVDIENQLYGKKKFDIRKFECALNDLLEILVEINNHLQFNTFLTANHVQLGDLMLASALFVCYNDVFTQIELDLFPNVIRVFRFVANMRYFKEVFGNAIQCKKVKKPEPYIEPVNDEIEEKNNKKDDNGEIDKKKKNKKDKKKQENK